MCVLPLTAAFSVGHNQTMMMVQSTLLKKTPLNANHAGRGAKLVEFGGWEMPLQFTKVLDEHHAVRQAAGLFDISHMGILSVHSGDTQVTLEAINALIPQDLTRIYAGKAVYTQLLNQQGGIIDDIIVYWLPELQGFESFKEFMIICNAANTSPVLAWLKAHLPASVQVDYLNAEYSLIALQGPHFQDVLAKGLTSEGPLPKRFHLAQYTLMGKPVLLSRTGYTGEDGVEILAKAVDIEPLWNALLDHGQSLGLLPVGLAARDTLRLEAAYPLHGAELSESITPLEAGLEWSVKLDQATDFIGKSALLAQQQAGLKRHFICFEMGQKSIPRHHDLVYDKGGNRIGDVTSGSISPTLEKPIGVGYVSLPEPPLPGTPILIEIRGKQVEAQIVARPFYRK